MIITPATRLRNAAEVALIIGAVQACIWILGPMVVADRSLVVLFWLLLSAGAAYILWLSPMLINHDRAELRGWGWPGERRRQGPGQWRLAWRWYATTTAVVVAGLIAVGWWRDPLIWQRVSPGTFAIRLSGYLLWGTAQAFVVFGFMQTRLRTAIPQPAGPRGVPLHQAAVALVTALIFSASHYPNGPLMGCTLAAGLVWSVLFYRRPNIWLLGTCHAVLGTVLHQFIRIGMRVGPFYRDMDGYVMRTVVPGLADFIGNRF